MEHLNRFLSFSFMFLLLASLFVVSTTPTVVRAVDTPSVPQFSVKIVGDYYYVLPSTTTIVDEYTGKETAVTRPDYYRDERAIVVSIKNQSFKSVDANGRQYSLYYNVQCKGHFGDEWRTFFHTTFQSDSDYTIFTTPDIGVYEAGDQLDFRVEAIIGHRDFDISTYHENVSWVYNVNNYDIFSMFLDVAHSGWSDVLTFTMPVPSEITTLQPSNTVLVPSNSLISDLTDPSTFSPTPQIPWVTYLLIIITTVCIATIPLAIVMYHNKCHQHKRKTKYSSNNPSSLQFAEVCGVKK